jgi:hypothetical protein
MGQQFDTFSLFTHSTKSETYKKYLKKKKTKKYIIVVYLLDNNGVRITFLYTYTHLIIHYEKRFSIFFQ